MDTQGFWGKPLKFCRPGDEGKRVHECFLHQSAGALCSFVVMLAGRPVEQTGHSTHSGEGIEHRSKILSLIRPTGLLPAVTKGKKISAGAQRSRNCWPCCRGRTVYGTAVSGEALTGGDVFTGKKCILSTSCFFGQALLRQRQASIVRCAGSYVCCPDQLAEQTPRPCHPIGSSPLNASCC